MLDDGHRRFLSGIANDDSRWRNHREDEEPGGTDFDVIPAGFVGRIKLWAGMSPGQIRRARLGVQSGREAEASRRIALIMCGSGEECAGAADIRTLTRAAAVMPARSFEIARPAVCGEGAAIRTVRSFALCKALR
jgi:hypothetical protein